MGSPIAIPSIWIDDRSILTAMTQPKDKLIVALDVSTKDDALALCDLLGASVGAFKIGLQLFTAEGPGFVREVVARGHRVFLDLKFHDIPNTVASAAVEAARLGVWMLNVHTSGGAEMMMRTVEAVKEDCEKRNVEAPLIIGVTVLTSSDATTLSEIGVESEANVQVERLSELAMKTGLDGVVASALEVPSIKKLSAGRPFLTVTPGIRPSEATFDDQKRVTSPKQAILNGSDFLVIGRPITRADNPAAVASAVVDEISS
jgi:orotidine-5'-phosphate decarboxylase